MKLAICLLLAVLCVSSAAATQTSPFEDLSLLQILSDRCNPNSPVFNATNTGMIESLGKWIQYTDIDIFDGNGTATTIASFTFWQINWYERLKCLFHAEHYDDVYTASGPGTMFQDVGTRPNRPTFTDLDRKRGYQGYETKWISPPSFNNMIITTSNTWQVAISPKSGATGWTKISDGSLVGTTLIEVIRPNLERWYLTTSYSTGILMYIRIHSLAGPMPARVLATQTAAYADDIDLQCDPAGLPYGGYCQNVLIYNLPPTRDTQEEITYPDVQGFIHAF